MKPDIVYIYGNGHSRWRGQELKYSLRSLEKFGKNFGNVFIVGDKPTYLNDKIIHIPQTEDKAHCKERRLMEKLLTACRTGEISDPFIFFNDDFFLTKEIDFAYLAYFYFDGLEAKISRRPKKDLYYRALSNTYAALIRRAYPTKHYDIHYPMYYHKKRFEEIMNSYDWTIPGGYVIKSLYANTMNVSSLPRKDGKIYHSHSRNEIIGVMKGTDLLSTDNITRTMATILMEKYSEKSSFEK